MKSLDWKSDRAVPYFVLLVCAVLSVLLYWQGFTASASIFTVPQSTSFFSNYLKTTRPFALVQSILTFVALGGLYYLGWKAVKKAAGGWAWALVLGSSLCFGIVLLFMYPFGASDIFDYIFRGRILGVYGANPFIQVPRDFSKDLFYCCIAWKKSPSSYGPLWELLAGETASLAGGNMLANLIAFKLLVAGFWAGTLAVAALMLRGSSFHNKLSLFYLLAWNPVILYECWGNGHNDIVMIFWVVLAGFAIQRKHYTISILALIAGGMIKYLPLLLLPAAGLVALRNLPGWRQRLRWMLMTGLLCAGFMFLLFGPFWNGWATFSVERKAQLYSTSIPAVIYQFVRPDSGNLPAAGLVSVLAAGITLLYTAVQSTHAWEKPGSEHSGCPCPEWESFIQISCNILLFYLLVTCMWVQQWYMVWVLCLLPFLKPRKRTLLILMGFAFLSKQFIVGPLIYWQTRWPKQPWLEVCVTLGVMSVPWLLTLFLTKSPDENVFTPKSEIP